MAEDRGEFVARRERMSLLAHVRKVEVPGDGSSVMVGGGPVEDVDLGNFVAVRATDVLWVSATPLITGDSRTSALAAALAWFSRGSGVAAINILDSLTPGLTARRAAYFSTPVRVLDANAAVATPTDFEPKVSARADHLEFTEVFRGAGADVVVEHGRVTAEVEGLEVARVVDEGGVPTMQIGVGAHDREMFTLLNGTTATSDQLRSVVQTVLQHRRAGAPTHPLNLLAPERALRKRVVSNPSLIGARDLRNAEPPVPRTNVKDSVPCCALGEDEHGPLLAVFVAGIDLDAVPFAADARSYLAPDARLLIVTASRNIVPAQTRMADMLVRHAEFVSA
ncbi:MAG: hypothetical protein ACO3FT_03550 [Ilumatobacteraceae bacterium]